MVVMVVVMVGWVERSETHRVRERAGAFRVIYVATFADLVYVLHAFQKKTRQTAKRDVELAASRLREQMARMR
jgi:phage-related protein